MSTTMTGLFVHVPKELMDKLREAAKQEDRSISAIVRRALLAYLDGKHDQEQSPDN
jgi:predicted transcriptional regulator